jgi:cytochrome c oxidase assembly protein subunit 11
MFGFGYALVPMYRAICDALGINVLRWPSSARQLDRPASQAANTQVDRSRTITVEFDANVRGPWDFKPAQRSMQVHPGELATVMYEFRTSRTARWPRRPSRATRRAGQRRTSTSWSASASTSTRWPGRGQAWPVAFVIDPKLPRT